MNVLYDDQIFRLQKYGGISRYFFELSNRLHEMDDASVEIAAPLYINRYFSSDAALRPAGVHLRDMRGAARITRVVNALTMPFMAKWRNGVDIFHETYYSMSDYCPRTAIRIITVYDMIHEKFPKYFYGIEKSCSVKAHAIARADHVICISKNTQRDLVDLLGVPVEKTSVVYLGYSLSGAGSATDQDALGEPYLLYVGMRGGYKNFEGLLRAYSQSSLLKSEFSIRCFGGGSLTPDEKSLIAALGISSDRVTQTGGGDTLLAGLYESAAAFIYPSLYEGFGIPPLEAMAYGCPVVCSNSSSMPEVVGNAAELFEPSNLEEMRAAIERVVSSSDRGAELVKRGQERIRMFSWQKCAHDTLSIYKNALQG